MSRRLAVIAAVLLILGAAIGLAVGLNYRSDRQDRPDPSARPVCVARTRVQRAGQHPRRSGRIRRMLPRTGQHRRAGGHRAHAPTPVRARSPSANTVIDSKIVNCNLDIRRTGVIIRKSEVHGHVQNPEGSTASFRVEDSFVDGSPNGPVEDRAIGFDRFTVVRSEVVGGNGGIYCRLNCTVQDSWVHGTELDPKSEWHASAVRVEQPAPSCTTPWPVTGRRSRTTRSAVRPTCPDIPTSRRSPTIRLTGICSWRIRSGLGFCAYGGGTATKPYS